MIRQPLQPRDQLALSIPLPQAFQAGVLEFHIPPRYILHILIICLAFMVAAFSGLSASQSAREANGSVWPFGLPSRATASNQSQYLSKPVLPFTLKSPLGTLAAELPLPAPAVPGAEVKKDRPIMIEYTVASGDTISGIADRYGVSTESVLWANQFETGDLIGVGDRIRIPEVSGVLLLVREGDTLAGLAEKYGVDAKVITDFKDNELSEPFNLRVGQLLMIPGGRAPDPPRPAPVARGANPPAVNTAAPKTQAPAQAQPSGVATGHFGWPTVGPIFTYFGEAGHLGIDISPSYGTPIYASDGGRVVTLLKLDYSYGWHVIIDHGNGFSTLYGHMSRFNVDYGDYVNKGQLIGWVGSTGKSTGPHLHFEIRINGAVVDPLKYLP